MTAPASPPSPHVSRDLGATGEGGTSHRSGYDADMAHALQREGRLGPALDPTED